MTRFTHDTPARRFCRSDFLRLARAQFAVLRTIWRSQYGCPING
jgi:hypothetical protein